MQKLERTCAMVTIDKEIARWIQFVVSKSTSVILKCIYIDIVDTLSHMTRFVTATQHNMLVIDFKSHLSLECGTYELIGVTKSEIRTDSVLIMTKVDRDYVKYNNVFDKAIIKPVVIGSIEKDNKGTRVETTVHFAFNINNLPKANAIYEISVNGEWRDTYPVAPIVFKGARSTCAITYLAMPIEKQMEVK